MLISSQVFANNKNEKKDLKWEFIEKKNHENLEWTPYLGDIQYEDISKNNKFSKSKFDIKATGKSVTVNDNLYPEISNYVPNGFVEDWRKIFTASFRGISRTRGCSLSNFHSRCRDGVLDLDFNLINKENFSLNPKINIQSLSNRGSAIGEGVSLGFKAAIQLSDFNSIAIGGENLIHFDDSIDLGRNFYIIKSYFIPLNKKKNPSALFVNAGLGSDFYGYRGNGFLGKTTCFGTPNLTGEGNNECSWGPIGSLTYAFNDRFAFVNEWFGYGYGSGVSVKPIKDMPIIFSFYLTDYIQGFPKYIQKSCQNNHCEPRYYGSMSITF